VTSEQLHEQLELVRVRGYGTDDEENEPGVNCLALPIFLSSPTEPSGAVSVSALTYRTTMLDLIGELSFFRRAVAGEIDEERQ
jgi:DNA-binding IclR family transcriptional regulator